LTISPTVNMYGSEFGTDKIAHLFQQGYTYYKISHHALAEGATPEEATAKAVRWGQKSERTFFGTLVAGVYSNGDLAANYVGLKFYEGLTQTITLGDSTRPAVLLLRDGLWTFNHGVNLRDVLLKPFISDHLSLGSADRTINVADGLADNDLVIDASIASVCRSSRLPPARSTALSRESM